MTEAVRDARLSAVPAHSRSVVWRVRQFMASALSLPNGDVDRALRGLIADDSQWALMARLSSFDRAHHLRVYEYLIEQSYDDRDLLLAALLHDVGKADQHGRAGVIARALRVLLRRAPRQLSRLTAERHPRILHSLYLAEHHARLGASMVAATGASVRCCDLISRHEDRAVHDDSSLAALVAADDAVIR
jgi:hypothetical protein